MENDKQQSENSSDEKTSQNANSSYSGSGSLRPGGSTGEAGKLNDYPTEDEETNVKNDNEDKSRNPEGKTIEETTDPSKVDKI